MSFAIHVASFRKLIESRRELLKGVDRKRTLRDSERAMTKALYMQQIEALEKAVEIMTVPQAEDVEEIMALRVRARLAQKGK